jgi:metal-responsive CopG/Arc/MetJ family transcriptional regulator
MQNGKALDGVMRTVTLKMPDALARKLEIAAKQEHVSRSALVRCAVEKYLEEDLASSSQPSAYALVEAFAGSVEGPRDLSTHPGHMEGYGE